MAKIRVFYGLDRLVGILFLGFYDEEGLLIFF